MTTTYKRLQGFFSVFLHRFFLFLLLVTIAHSYGFTMMEFPYGPIEPIQSAAISWWPQWASLDSGMHSCLKNTWFLVSNSTEIYLGSCVLALLIFRGVPSPANCTHQHVTELYHETLEQVFKLISLLSAQRALFFFLPTDAHALLHVNDTVLALKFILLLASSFYLLMLRAYFFHASSRGIDVLILFTISLLFSLLALAAVDLITLLFGLTGLSLTILAFLGYEQQDSRRAVGAVQYFIFSGFSTVMYVIAMFLIRLTLGGEFFSYSSLSSSLYSLALGINTSAGTHHNLVLLGLLLLCLSLFLKLGVFPMSNWLIVVYCESATYLTIFLLVFAKGVYFAAIVRLLGTLFFTFDLHGFSVISVVHSLFGLVGIMSLVGGCLFALSSHDIKQFVGFSSMNQLGYLLISLYTGTSVGYAYALNAFFVYAATLLVFFVILLSVNMKLPVGDKLSKVSDFYLIGLVNKTARALLVLILFSFSGLPPFIGFFYKYLIFVELARVGSFTLLWVALITTLVSTYYYLSIVFDLLFITACQERQYSSLLFYSPQAVSYSLAQEGCILWSVSVAWVTVISTPLLVYIAGFLI